jgi:uncharacterized protein with PQ loop repeat
MDTSLTLIAGTTSTIIFAASALPMLTRAYRTRDLASYSRDNILMANIGNVVHSLYVYSLPPGPIWLLHAFYLVSTAMMLVWYLRYEWRPRFSLRPRAPEYPTRIPHPGNEFARSKP